VTSSFGLAVVRPREEMRLRRLRCLHRRWDSYPVGATVAGAGLTPAGSTHLSRRTWTSTGDAARVALATGWLARAVVMEVLTSGAPSSRQPVRASIATHSGDVRAQVGGAKKQDQRCATSHCRRKRHTGIVRPPAQLNAAECG
jgi:hypothetical protein